MSCGITGETSARILLSNANSIYHGNDGYMYVGLLARRANGENLLAKHCTVEGSGKWRDIISAVAARAIEAAGVVTLDHLLAFNMAAFSSARAMARQRSGWRMALKIWHRRRGASCICEEKNVAGVEWPLTYAHQWHIALDIIIGVLARRTPDAHCVCAVLC